MPSKIRHGGPKLKGTQEYPQRFARKVFKLHQKHKVAGFWLSSQVNGAQTLFSNIYRNGPDSFLVGFKKTFADITRIAKKKQFGELNTNSILHTGPQMNWKGTTYKCPEALCEVRIQIPLTSKVLKNSLCNTWGKLIKLVPLKSHFVGNF